MMKALASARSARVIASRPVAAKLRETLTDMLGDPLPLGIEFWDGSQLGPINPPGLIKISSPQALRRMMWAPGELGMARAFVSGEIEVHGDVIRLLTIASMVRRKNLASLKGVPALAFAASQIGALGPPPQPPAIEYRPPRRRAHTVTRDAASISHHYDVSPTFYRMVLGTSMTYSCARFTERNMTLAEAQSAKHDHVCRKLGLADAPGQRLLDVGCGWGQMAIHAASTYGARVVGITISAEQAATARQRVAEAEVADRVEIRLQDYRELGSETFDVVSSIGMSEHVGHRNLETYFGILRGALRPYGRILNHAISSVGGSRIPRNTFIYRYVFPDGELVDLSQTIHAMQRVGFEIRDVESLREHYATTLTHWVRNLESQWEAAVDEVGLARAKVWLLYMAASAVGFTDGGLNVHQVLGVVNDSLGHSHMPVVRPA
jgi:cyclopropane-fatty-acyl-phospholipid synthase